MNSKIIWNDQIPERDGVKTPINDIAISPGFNFILYRNKLTLKTEQELLLLLVIEYYFINQKMVI